VSILKYFQHAPLGGLSYDLIQENSGQGRTYLTPSGARYPSVSSVMGKINQGAIIAWRKRVGTVEANRVSTDAAGRGTTLHKVCESYLNNDLKPDEELGDRTNQLFQQLRPWLDQHVQTVHGTEVPLYSDTLKLAGTCDLIVTIDGIMTVVDYKTSGKPKRRDWCQHYVLQCAAYALMIHERTGLRVPHVAILIAVEGQTQPTIICEKTRPHLDELYEVLTTYGALSS
jgi:hypothetical protein